MPFLQAAVADERVGVVVDQPGAEAGVQIGLRDRHAERVGDALPQRAGRHFDAARRIELRMTFAVRTEFAEGLDLVERDLLIAGQVQQREQQHRSVAVGQHEAVAVRPGRIGRIELHVPGEERRGDLRHAERNALVPLGGAHDRVDRDEADRMG